MKKIISLILVLMLLMPTAVVFANEPWVTPDIPLDVLPFDDVSLDDWFYSDVGFVYFNDYMIGTSDKLFSPNLPVTRAMVVAVLWRYENQPSAHTSMIFPDVSASSYYAKAVDWASANQIVIGFDDGTFKPDLNIKREELAAIIYRYCKFKGIALSGTPVLFNDSAEISDWAAEAVNAISASGIIKGKDGNIFDSKANTKRSEFAAILNRLSQI